MSLDVKTQLQREGKKCLLPCMPDCLCILHWYNTPHPAKHGGAAKSDLAKCKTGWHHGIWLVLFVKRMTVYCCPVCRLKLKHVLDALPLHKYLFKCCYLILGRPCIMTINSVTCNWNLLHTAVHCATNNPKCTGFFGSLKYSLTTLRVHNHVRGSVYMWHVAGIMFTVFPS